MLTKKNPEEKTLQPQSPLKTEKSREHACCTPGQSCSETTWGRDKSTQASSLNKKTRIHVRYDVGFSNSLSIRGKGANLSWERGVPLKNIKPDLWVWETELPATVIEFKILLNDRVYEEGSNRTLKSGSQVEYTPKFPAANH